MDYPGQDCPEGEPYVAFAAMEEYSRSKIEISDVKIRASDRMQYVTGTYTDYDPYYIDANNGPQPNTYDNINFDIGLNCFIAKVSPSGDIQDTMYIKTLNTDWVYFGYDD